MALLGDERWVAGRGLAALTRALAALLPQRAGTVDAYVLSIALDSDPVFGREARVAGTVLAARYGAQGGDWGSAVTTALAVSGLPTDRFCFEGFLPRKAGERRRRLAALADEQRTMVFFESPRRTAVTLAEMAEAFGADRPGALCRELTKTYEEVRRGPLADLAAAASADEVLGEVTLVVAGAGASPNRLGPQDLVRAYQDALAAGLPRSAAMRQVAERLGVSRRDVYDAVLAAKQATEPPA